MQYWGVPPSERGHDAANTTAAVPGPVANAAALSGAAGNDAGQPGPGLAPTGDGWLGLLARDPTMADALAYRRELLDAAAGPERAEIKRQARQALTILERLAERRVHADELTVLNDLARRLASLHEPRNLLQEVASQARRLLHADVAYLMLRQDLMFPQDGAQEGSGGGDKVRRLLRIEVSDGSLGSILAGTEVGLGEGLGGQVLRAGTPLWTEDYLQDSMIAHLSDVDEVASSEHLGGILGVPLTVGEETLGVLLASNRRPRKFTEREIELLAALAAHASVAIRNSQLYKQQQRSEDQLRHAVDELKAANATRQRAFDLRERLTQRVVSGGKTADILAELHDATGLPVRFEDAGNAEFAALFADSRTDAPYLDTSNGRHRAAVPVMLSTGYGGAVVADSPGPLDGEALRLLPLGATSIAILLATDRSLAEMEMRARSEFMNTLLGGHADEDSVARHASAAGIDMGKVSAVVVVSAGPGTKENDEARRLATRVARHFQGWSGHYAEHMVALLPDTEVAPVKEYVQRLTVGNFPGAVGLASCGSGIRAVRSAHTSAVQTTTMLNALGRPHDVAEDSELGIYRAVFSQSGRDDLAAFVQQCVGRLLDHDLEHGRQLAATLSTYLELSQHHARTCAALHIHANTLYNRLERMDALIGPGWKDPARSLDIQLALRLNRLMETLGQQPGGRAQPPQEP